MLLEDVGLYIKVKVYGMYVKFLVDIGVIYIIIVDIVWDYVIRNKIKIVDFNVKYFSCKWWWIVCFR